MNLNQRSGQLRALTVMQFVAVFTYSPGHRTAKARMSSLVQVYLKILLPPYTFIIFLQPIRNEPRCLTSCSTAIVHPKRYETQDKRNKNASQHPFGRPSCISIGPCFDSYLSAWAVSQVMGDKSHVDKPEHLSTGTERKHQLGHRMRIVCTCTYLADRVDIEWGAGRAAAYLQGIYLHRIRSGLSTGVKAKNCTNFA